MPISKNHLPYSLRQLEVKLMAPSQTTMESKTLFVEYFCSCGCTFLQDTALTKHRQTCPKVKKCFLSTLEKAKEIWVGRKQRCMTGTVSQNPETTMQPMAPGLMPTTPVPELDAAKLFMEVSVTTAFTVFPQGNVAHGTGKYRRLAFHNDGTAAVDPANQPQAAKEI